VIEAVQPIAEQAWVKTRPTLNQLLKATIGTLQSAVDHLEQQMATDTTNAEPLNIEPVKKAINTFWAKTQPTWANIISFVRSRLPADVNTKLGDRALSGILAGLALLLLSITTHLPSGKAAPKPVPVAKPMPPVAAKPVPVRPLPSRADAIAKQFPVDTAQGNKQAFPTDLSAPAIQSPAVAKVPPTASSVPVTPSPQSATPTPATTPAAPVRLTAEQKLMAKLKAAVGDQADLLASIKLNKRTDSLQITLEPDWYDLTFGQQDELAKRLLAKAQALRLKTLELLDGQGAVVARSPVVGDEMVVLLRQTS
jgi:hypothetical protein